LVVGEPCLGGAGVGPPTPRGRVATAAGWRHLGRTPPNGTFAGGAATAPDLFSLES
jgi:Holliday junction DNA helicase RuvB